MYCSRLMSNNKDLFIYSIVVSIMIMSSDVSVDCPTTVTVTPSSGPFNVGDVLTCTSDGYPEPIFQWTNSDGVVMSSTSMVTLSGGSFNLTCTATGKFATPCSATNAVSGVATCKYEQQNGVTLALPVGTSAVLVVVKRSHLHWTTRGCRQRTTRHRLTEIYLPALECLSFSLSGCPSVCPK